MKKLLRMITAAAVSLLSVISISLSAGAEDLPEGFVKGIPEGLYVMDEDGKSISRSGEYCVDISGMKPGETYTKILSIQNLINTPYTLTMSAAPISSNGNLDLEKHTNLKLYLDGKLIYDGKVTGEGNVNMNTSPLDLGEVVSGQSKELKAEILWNGDGLKDIEGQKYLGRVDFKWVFEAVLNETVTEPDSPDSNRKSVMPNTGTDSLNLLLIFFAVILFIAAVFVGLMTRRCRKDGTDDSKEE